MVTRPFKSLEDLKRIRPVEEVKMTFLLANNVCFAIKFHKFRCNFWHDFYACLSVHTLYYIIN